MTRDPLATLLKVRRQACDDALCSLVAAVEAENSARSEAQVIERRMADEARVATDPQSSDQAVEAFAVWLTVARRQLATAEQAVLQREAETARKRAELTACRTALETIETLQQEREAAERRKRDASEQRELDDRPLSARPGI